MKDLNNLKKLIKQVSDEQIWNLVQEGKAVAYLGIDPTGSGIHIGHLLPLHILINLLKLGNKVIILIGGFTGSIGDPTDKLQTRNKIDDNTVINNSAGLFNDIKRIFKPYDVTYVNNNDWMGKMTIGDYMYYGYSISVNKKVNMETFKNRLNSQNSLTMTEFMYSDLQMIDFCYLNKTYGCNLQVGGADQWGNIAFGTHYTAQINNTSVYGMVSHLLISNNGAKFSKSTGAFHARDFEKTYHGCMNLDDNTSDELCNLLNVKMEENPQNTKKNLAKYFISLFELSEYEEIYNKIEEKARVLFTHKDCNGVPQEYFQKVKSNMLLNVLMEVFDMQEFEAEIAIKDKQIKIDSIVQFQNISIPTKCKISCGKKLHAFVMI